MEPFTIICEKCGQSAIVHSVRYLYEEGTIGSPQTDGRPVNTELEIECPKCGKRTQYKAPAGA
jgi:hypothetical protein